MPRDFNYDILAARAHRPWPMPSQPWVMTQTWHDLLFAHWPVPAAELLSRIPADLELDLFDGQAWLGIVPFRMSNVTPRGIPALPGLSAFPELNVRTYVRVADRPGVCFFSLDAANAIAVAVARTLFHLTYYRATMRVDLRNGEVQYDSRRNEPDTRGRLVGVYAPEGQSFTPRPVSLDYFLTERYCLYTTRRDTLLTVDIHHPPWLLQAARASFEVNTIADAAGIHVAGPPALLHFSKRQDIVAWAPRRV
jgi:uncharacterized protein YqjF (DUF2071 family)